MAPQIKRSTPAPMWRRALAFLIDIILIDIFLASPFWALVKKTTNGGGFTEIASFLASHPNAIFSINIAAIFIALVAMSYFVILEGVIGQTIGMLLLNLRVVSAHSHFHWWQLIVRNLFLIPLFPFALFLITEPLYLLWKRGEYRLLEQLSKTRTIIA